jgi:hypothetical protein
VIDSPNPLPLSSCAAHCGIGAVVRPLSTTSLRCHQCFYKRSAIAAVNTTMHQRLLQLFSKAVSLKIHLSDVFSQSLALFAARRYRILSGVLREY